MSGQEQNRFLDIRKRIHCIDTYCRGKIHTSNELRMYFTFETQKQIINENIASDCH